ncbi:AMP-binding, conserved site,AMP-dependent synthetase/ligase,Phosphopantetheine binding ACP domain [Cinara cedri]|uniref:AMP-binding, conserved site,AMP-dependent synthetase/ligase,Phosphopantetheine binding ACP domain n=1 Tax=Cinara cedri TaxID=506608 RepID=A0A5E4MQ73_9HEMI|nr:AMP-binding, conserved site,AMP-dependent synthetase/ligase,Phosphopantetheine binding ACP domain [Cinara cedri]
MDVYPATSVLRGPFYTINGDVKLHRLFERNENAYPDSTAVIHEVLGQPSARLSFAELNAKSNQLARGIVAHAGPLNGDGDFVVAVQLTPDDGLIAALLAIWKAGAAYLPVDTDAPAHRIRHVLDEAKPCMMITNKPDAEVYGDKSSIVYTLKQLKSKSAILSACNLEDRETLAGYGGRRPAIIIYTSGSTGTPKGVRLPHCVVYNRLNWQWNRFPYSDTERTCVFKTSLTFVDSVAEIWAPLLHDTPRALMVVPKAVTKDPERLINMLHENKIERLVLVPSLLRAILLYLGISNNNEQQPAMRNQNNEHGILSSLKLWVCSGEPLPMSLAKQFLDTFPSHFTLCNFYGSTEIMGDVSYFAIKSFDDLRFGDKIPIGVPVDNTALYLLDDKGQTVPPGSLGELYVAGANLASGYVNGRDPHRFIENSRRRDRDLGMDRMYQTGDYGKMVDGVLLYEGRTDSQIKVRGHRVDLSEVEASVLGLSDSGIDKVAVLCYKPGETEQTLLAFVVFDGKTKTTAAHIEDRLKESLPEYSLPQVIELETMPYLVNGKIDRQTLLRRYSETSVAASEKCRVDMTGVSADRTEAAKCLFETVSTVLGSSLRSRVSVAANFFALGGHSLNAIYTISKLADFGYSIAVSDFITAPNFGIVINKMRFSGKTSKANRPSCFDDDQWLSEKYTMQMLEPKHKEDVIKIIAESFYEKADMEHWLKPKVPYSDYTDILEMLWEPLLEKDLSFVVHSKESDQLLGAALNFDALDEPEVEFNGRLSVIFEFLEYLEGPIRRDHLPKSKGSILHSFMMGTDKSLDTSTNVEVITYMEQRVLRLGKAKQFKGIFTTNTNPLTQQLGANVFGYKILHDYQINKYVTPDGRKIFDEAPDDQRAICCWKVIQ